METFTNEKAHDLGVENDPIHLKTKPYAVQFDASEHSGSYPGPLSEFGHYAFLPINPPLMGVAKSFV